MQHGQVLRFFNTDKIINLLMRFKIIIFLIPQTIVIISYSEHEHHLPLGDIVVKWVTIINKKKISMQTHKTRPKTTL